MAPQSTTGRSGPGCFGYGCFIAVVLFSVVIGGVAYYGVKSIREAVVKYTTTSAPPLPMQPVDESSAQSGGAKFQMLKEAFEKSQPLSMELSESELRAIVTRLGWAERVSVSLIGEEINLLFSIPLRELGEWKAGSLVFGDLTSRAIRGETLGRVSVVDGVISVKLSKLILNDQQLEDMPRGHAADWIVGAINEAVTSEGEVVEEGKAPMRLKGIRTASVQGGRLLVELK